MPLDRVSPVVDTVIPSEMAPKGFATFGSDACFGEDRRALLVSDVKEA